MSAEEGGKHAKADKSKVADDGPMMAVSVEKVVMSPEVKVEDLSCGNKGSPTRKENASLEETAPSVISDSHSEPGYSSDSGKGCSGSDTVTSPVKEQENGEQRSPESLSNDVYSDPMIYEFEIPQMFVGRLIGRYGSFINEVMRLTRTIIMVKKHPSGHSLRICAIEGGISDIEHSLNLIRERFPENKYPSITLDQINLNLNIAPPISYLPASNKLNLIEGVINDVTLSCVVSLDHIFVQQPTHPTFTALARLHVALKELYSRPVAPKLFQPFHPGVICVAPVNDDAWCRSEVIAIEEESRTVTARLVDVGGYITVPIDSLRQIRVDFVSIPFQATECRLAHVVPVKAEGWSEDAVTYVKILAQNHVLQASVVGYSAKDSVTLIHLYCLTPEHNFVFVNQELVSLGYAQWINEVESVTSVEEDFNQLTISYVNSTDSENAITVETQKSNLKDSTGKVVQNGVDKPDDDVSGTDDSTVK